MSKKKIRGFVIALCLILLGSVIIDSQGITASAGSFEDSVDQLESEVADLGVTVRGNTESLDSMNYVTSDNIVVKSFSVDNVSISAASYATGTITSVSYSGYTPKGVVGYNITNATTSGANGSYVTPYRLYQSGSTIYYSLKTRTSSNAAKVKLTVYVLFVKTN